jgi:hypothetical protein
MFLVHVIVLYFIEMVLPFSNESLQEELDIFRVTTTQPLLHIARDVPNKYYHLHLFGKKYMAQNLDLLGCKIFI